MRKYNTCEGVNPVPGILFCKFKVNVLYPCGSANKESACNVGDLGSIPGLGRSPGEGNSYPLQYSGLENSMDKGAWQATVHGDHKEWDTTERLSHTHKCYLHTITSSYIGSIQSSSRRMYCGTKDKGLTRSHPD